IATNTSSFLVGDFADSVKEAKNLVGMHYFFHPAKNRLVDVIGHADTDPGVLQRAWTFQERIGKTPIASADAPGFVVNRYFVPWLNEAVRLHEEGHSIATIEAAGKKAFGVGMGPFELMNVTGVPIALHAARALAERLGGFYTPAERLAEQVDKGCPWRIDGRPQAKGSEEIEARLWGAVLHPVLELLSEEVTGAADVDIGARVGLRWPIGPCEKMAVIGGEAAADLAKDVGDRYRAATPAALKDLAAGGDLPQVERVRLTIRDGVATLLINRPDQLNALDPETMAQLEARFAEAEARADVHGIVIAGAGKAFVAGADVKFFVDRMRSGDVDEIIAFADNGQKIFRRIERSTKRVVCRLDGMALGGGAELALACHVIVATERAVFGFPETGIGIYPGLGGTQRLTRRLGRGTARYLLYTGTTLSAGDLEKTKLAWRVVSPDDLEDTLRMAIDEAPVQEPADKETMPSGLRDVGRFLGAVSADGLLDGSLTLPGGVEIMEVARKIRRKAPQAIRSVAVLTELADEGDLDAGLAAETEGLKSIFRTADALEGMSALLEKRRPSFKGE
ncbi:MAG: enoyl-CoA hydratase-related protein, partial [Myxococcota bacterium]